MESWIALDSYKNMATLFTFVIPSINQIRDDLFSSYSVHEQNFSQRLVYYVSLAKGGHQKERLAINTLTILGISKLLTTFSRYRTLNSVLYWWIAQSILRSNVMDQNEVIFINLFRMKKVRKIIECAVAHVWVHRQNVPRKNVPRDKRSQGQNITRTKRPKGQNVLH